MSDYKDGDPGFEVLSPSGTAGRDLGGLDTSWRARYEGRKLARTVQGLTGGLRVVAAYNEAATRAELARQELEYARQQGALVPLKIERERLQLHGQILEGRALLGAALQRHQQAAELSAADHEIALLERRERRLALKARIKAKKRELDDYKQHKPADRRDEGTDDFRRHWQTEQRVRVNRSEADRRIDAIFDRARSERRNLTPDELEEVDALVDAAEAAEGDVRRRAAGGL